MATRVAINGFGTIGKRVADAVAAMPDMRVVGITKTRPTAEAWLAASRHFPLYGVAPEHVSALTDAGLQVEGTLSDLLQQADVVVDCSPGKKGAANVAAYEAAKVKAIFQGGEKHAVAGFSFNALVNYKQALGRSKARVVSCNTTGLIRTLFPLHKTFGIDHAHAVIVRRGADPSDSESGPINAIEPVLQLPSHHGPDVATVLEGLSITTMAVAVPTTLMHVHAIQVDLTRPPKGLDAVLDAWQHTPRVMLVRGDRGVVSTAQVMEQARDLGRQRSDLQEIALWEDGIALDGHKLYYYQAIHQESNVVPENIDCIRALHGKVKDQTESMRLTDKVLGLSTSTYP